LSGRQPATVGAPGPSGDAIASSGATDRAAAVRAALRELVAERGFHGASMSAVAKRAGVATGTAYVHYSSKDELVLAAYLESKRSLGGAAVAGIDPGAPPEQRFRSLWSAAFEYLRANRGEARFLVQADGSPYAESFHREALAVQDDPLLAAAEAPDMAALLLPLAVEVLYELGLAPAVHLAARGADLDDAAIRLAAGGCWRAITDPDPDADGVSGRAGTQP
jgi:AcrR family transcriptional regulator